MGHLARVQTLPYLPFDSIYVLDVANFKTSWSFILTWIVSIFPSSEQLWPLCWRNWFGAQDGRYWCKILRFTLTSILMRYFCLICFKIIQKKMPSFRHGWFIAVGSVHISRRSLHRTPRSSAATEISRMIKTNRNCCLCWSWGTLLLGRWQICMDFRLNSVSLRL